jgi:hypothetical protein
MKSLQLAFVALASSLVMPVAIAQATITFKVPYKYTNISTEYNGVQIICGVSKNGEAIGSAIGSKIVLDANGSASGSASVEAKANPGKSLADATDWVCNSNFLPKSGGSFAHTNDVAKAGTNPVGSAKGRF